MMSDAAGDCPGRGTTPGTGSGSRPASAAASADVVARTRPAVNVVAEAVGAGAWVEMSSGSSSTASPSGVVISARSVNPTARIVALANSFDLEAIQLAVSAGVDSFCLATAAREVLINILELTMLGAIIATVITLVVTARLGRGGRLYDPQVTEGKILVGVENPRDGAKDVLRAALGGEVRTVGE